MLRNFAKSSLDIGGNAFGGFLNLMQKRLMARQWGSGKLVFTVLIVGSVIGLKVVALPILGVETPFLFAGITVLLCSWFGGQACGIVAAAIFAVSVAYFFIDPLNSLGVKHTRDILQLAFFLVEGSAIGPLCKAIRKAQSVVMLQTIQLKAEISQRVLAQRVLEQQQTELKEAKDQAEAANKAKSSFLNNMSHEIRTPLGAIIGFCDLMSDSKLSPKDRAAYSERVRRNGNLLINIVNDVLDIAKIEANKLQFNWVNVRISEVIDDILISLRPIATKNQINMTAHIDPDVPEFVVSDGHRLKQVLLNIVGNAAKFTVGGDVKVYVSMDGGADGKVVFRVEDTGIGISVEQSKKLFRPFEQGNQSISREYGGTGLGLVLSRRLARALGGDVILAESVVGKGSTFIISIRAMNGALPGGKVAPAGAARKAAELDAMQSVLNGVKILLVDDSPDLLLLIETYLSREGAVVTVAENGVEGLEKLRHNHFDVVLMDIQMPLMDGLSACAAARANHIETPMIALSANAMKEEKQVCISSGFNLYLTKPVAPKKLVTSIQEVICNRPV